MTTTTAIRDLAEGQMFDLGTIESELFLCTEGTCSDCDSIYVAMEFEYATVDGVTNDPNHLTLLATSHGTFYVPSGLLVEVIEIPLDNDSGL